MERDLEQARAYDQEALALYEQALALDDPNYPLSWLG